MKRVYRPVLHPSQVMTDNALIKQFKADPATGYSSLLDRYTPIILRMIRRFLTDPDEVMETYTAICERMRHNNFQALRRFRINSELTPWLSVVVANACRDRFRKYRMTSMPNSVISKLDERERLIFKYYYQEYMQHQEIVETLQGRHGMSCSRVDVSRAIARIDDMLSVNKRWHLLTALRANRPMLSLEDLNLARFHPGDRKTSYDSIGEEDEEEMLVTLNKVIKELDTEDQLLVSLRFEHGMRATQIAKVMQFENHKYVYTRLRTIINRLRRELVD